MGETDEYGCHIRCLRTTIINFFIKTDKKVTVNMGPEIHNNRAN